MDEPVRLHFVVGVVAFSALLLPAAALGQGGVIPDTRPPLDELIDRLDSAVFAARQQATADLFGRDNLSLDDAELLLSDPELSPEQRLRLERVALRVFGNGPRAAVGISFPLEGNDGVRIREVVPNFPASELLRPGDRILEADGLTMARQATFRAAILSHSPGDVMPVKLVRAGETIELDVPLGSFGSLVGAARPRPGDLHAAWTLRRARDGATPFGRTIEPERVSADGESALPERGTRAWESAFSTPDAPRGLRVGGQVRESIDRSLAQLAAMDASRALTLEDLQASGAADLAAQISILRQRRELILDDMNRLSDLIEGRNLDAGGRAMMRRRLEDERQMLLVLEEQIRVLSEAQRAKP